jgi:hypothetical protein
MLFSDDSPTYRARDRNAWGIGEPARKRTDNGPKNTYIVGSQVRLRKVRRPVLEGKLTGIDHNTIYIDGEKHKFKGFIGANIRRNRPHEGYLLEVAKDE